LLVSSQARFIEMPDQLFGDNYEGLKDFINGLMKGFRDDAAELPEECLSADSQAKINHDIVAFFLGTSGDRQKDF
jgi:hypothetical protein